MEFFNDKDLAAVFFIPRENRQKEDIKTLLVKAKATDIKQPLDPEDRWDCQWADMSCEAYLHGELLSYQILVIFFLQGVFLKGIPLEDSDLPLEEDENLNVALTFRDACEALEPEIAYIATHLYYAEFEWILKTIDKIETYDSDSIADEAGLVYFNNEILIDLITERPPGEERDTLPVNKGKLLFGGRGSKRWW